MAAWVMVLLVSVILFSSNVQLQLVTLSPITTPGPTLLLLSLSLLSSHVRSQISLSLISEEIYNNDITPGLTTQCSSQDDDCHIFCDGTASSSNCNSNTFVFNSSSSATPPNHYFYCSACTDITIIAVTSALRLEFETFAATHVFADVTLIQSESAALPANLNLSCSGPSACTNLDLNVYSAGETDLLSPIDNLHGSVSVFVDDFGAGLGNGSLIDSVINAVSVNQLDVHCVSGCRALNIYPPNYGAADAQSHFALSIDQGSTSWTSVPQIQVFAPVAIETADITCPADNGKDSVAAYWCSLSVYCGVRERKRCDIDSLSQISECHSLCSDADLNITNLQALYAHDLDDAQTTSDNGIIYDSTRYLSHRFAHRCADESISLRVLQNIVPRTCTSVGCQPVYTLLSDCIIGCQPAVN